MRKDINASRGKFPQALGRRFETAIRANQAATDMFDEAVTEFLGINRTDGRCIDIIDRGGRMTAGQLAAESGLTTGAVTAVIDRLETAGYVRRTRDRGDRRKVWIETTEEIRAISARIFGLYARLNPAVLSRFTPDQFRAIGEFLEMGAVLNRELSAVLKDHISPAAATTQARLEQAAAFERAVLAAQPRLEAALGAVRYEAGEGD